MLINAIWMIEEWKYLPDVYSTTSTVPSTANLQVVAACSVWLSVNTGSQSWGYWSI
jgi:hypothetical protein